MIIKVTQKHIKNGKVHDCEQCPVALALSEYFVQPYVEADRAEVRHNTEWYAIELPWVVTRFIEDFDQGGLVAPFEFDAKLCTI